MNTPFYNSIAEALVSIFGSQVSIASSDRIQGGDINKAYALTLNTGDRVFMKANTKENVKLFSSEAEGLSAIKATGAVKTPEVL